MAEPEDSTSSLSSVAAGVAGVRESLERLSEAIGSINDEAEQLRVSAAVHRSEVAVLERTPIPEVTEEARAAELEELLSLLRPTPAPASEPDPPAFIFEPALAGLEVTPVPTLDAQESMPEPSNSSGGLAFGAPEKDRAAPLVTYDHRPETAVLGQPLDDAAPSEIPDVSIWEASEGELAALDRFFSSDVEPEPSQKWLLDN